LKLFFGKDEKRNKKKLQLEVFIRITIRKKYGDRMSKLDFSNNKKSISTKMTLNNSQKLLAGFVALVLVAGMTSPAFAQESTIQEGSEPLILISQQNALEDLIYDNGGDPVPFSGRITDTEFIAFDDFVLTGSAILEDAHFVFQIFDNWDGTIEYFVFTDDGGAPGELIGTGNAINIETEELGPGILMVWFDLEEPIPLESDVTYWFGIHTGGGFSIWVSTTTVTGNISCSLSSADLSFVGCGFFDLWFQLTGDTNQPIGGTSIPVSTTTLLVAGVQANMGLWSLALVGMVAAGAAIIYKTKSKKTEQ